MSGYVDLTSDSAARVYWWDFESGAAEPVVAKSICVSAGTVSQDLSVGSATENAVMLDTSWKGNGTVTAAATSYNQIYKINAPDCGVDIWADPSTFPTTTTSSNQYLYQYQHSIRNTSQSHTFQASDTSYISTKIREIEDLTGDIVELTVGGVGYPTLSQAGYRNSEWMSSARIIVSS